MRVDRREFLAVSAGALAVGGSTKAKPAIEVFDRRAGKCVELSAQPEVLASGFGWSEGPTWDWDLGRLYFTDVPGNKAFSWSESERLGTFLDPSGTDQAEGFREPGANGLLYTGQGSLLLCNHGRRRLERLSIASGERRSIVSDYRGRKFNSPNDVSVRNDGLMVFTDPPYGLAGGDASPLKELDVNGVYAVLPGGEAQLLVDDLVRPNGAAFSPDGEKLYVTQSDAERPILRELIIDEKARVRGQRELFNFSPLMDEEHPGLPDGMAVAETGEIFVAGPGGVVALSPDGELLFRIRTGKATANCCFGEGGRTLFMTAHDQLMRIPTKCQGLAWS
ncbi:MAG: SMP-30/gluconolactonase/LRE family protein [Pseudomonadota bacterium]